MDKPDTIVFSDEQQAAVIGYALQKKETWDLLIGIGLDKKWFVKNQLSDFWEMLLKFKATYGKLPATKAEISDNIQDDLLRRSAETALKLCVDSKAKHSWSTLEVKLSEWAKGYCLFTSFEAISQKYNSGKFDEACEALAASSSKIKKIEASFGVDPDRFKSSADRTFDEERGREDGAKNAIPYEGLSFLKDSLRSILPGEVLLLGAGTGVGKTQLAKILAQHVAMTGKRVHYIALEAEDNEIERRMKFGFMSKWYREEHPGGAFCNINYSNFVHEDLKTEFGPYEKRANDLLVNNYKTLHTYYKVKDDFGIDELDRELVNLAGKTDLVILDHIHYVDLDGHNETAAMSALIKRIKNLSSALKIPVVCVAHVKKPDKIKGVAPIVPSLDDFYGASNLTKIALTAIMLAPAVGIISSNTRGYGVPTFFRVLKCRLDRTQTDYTGVCYFNILDGEYTDYYSLGKLNRMCTKWTPEKSNFPYWVDHNKICIDVSEYGE